MDFSLSYSGAPGAISATLIEGGFTVATTTGLKDGTAARKWARREARDHKVSNTPAATEGEHVSVSGTATFSV